MVGLFQCFIAKLTTKQNKSLSGQEAKGNNQCPNLSFTSCSSFYFIEHIFIKQFVLYLKSIRKHYKH